MTKLDVPQLYDKVEVCQNGIMTMIMILMTTTSTLKRAQGYEYMMNAAAAMKIGTICLFFLSMI